MSMKTLLQLQEGERSAKEAMRKAEAEVLEILKVRAQEELDPELTISIYDTERNEKSKEQREALERAAREERLQCALLELDYLASFLARLGNPERLTRAQAQQVREDCLSDLKHRLIEQANLIQARFEKVSTSTPPVILSSQYEQGGPFTSTGNCPSSGFFSVLVHVQISPHVVKGISSV
ncbi:unnamed protein product [Staurois parvus]|uniref:Uncharacterized protein n=1 Tax=Staurois parvus TaxID=386267 RepID=A0ABN9H4J1_9NEOB|nr:unnamed protein product [Staurois parvus]